MTISDDTDSFSFMRMPGQYALAILYHAIRLNQKNLLVASEPEFSIPKTGNITFSESGFLI